MLKPTNVSSSFVPTLFAKAPLETYTYRRFGSGDALPLLCLQHFTGTLDNWDPAVVDPLAMSREVILFESAGVGRSTGQVPETIEAMATHALAFVDALGLSGLDVLGFSLGGMVAQVMALERPTLFKKLILAGTAPEGGEDIMQIEKPHLEVLAGLFFTDTESSRAAGRAFIQRLALRAAAPVSTKCCESFLSTGNGS